MYWQAVGSIRKFEPESVFIEKVFSWNYSPLRGENTATVSLAIWTPERAKVIRTGVDRTVRCRAEGVRYAIDEIRRSRGLTLVRAPFMIPLRLREVLSYRIPAQMTPIYPIHKEPQF